MNEEDANEKQLWQTLRKLELLRGVADEHVQELAKLGRFVDFPKDKVIFHNGDPAVHCYLITEGRVSLEICSSPSGCTQILTVSEGDLLGWSSVLGAPQLTATARTLTETQAIELTGRELFTLCEQNPEFGYQWMRCTALALAQRLSATRLQLLDLYHTEIPTTGESR